MLLLPSVFHFHPGARGWRSPQVVVLLNVLMMAVSPASATMAEAVFLPAHKEQQQASLPSWLDQWLMRISDDLELIDIELEEVERQELGITALQALSPERFVQHPRGSDLEMNSTFQSGGLDVHAIVDAIEAWKLPETSEVLEAGNARTAEIKREQGLLDMHHPLSLSKEVLSLAENLKTSLGDVVGRALLQRCEEARASVEALVDKTADVQRRADQAVSDASSPWDLQRVASKMADVVLGYPPVEQEPVEQELRALRAEVNVFRTDILEDLRTDVGTLLAVAKILATQDDTARKLEEKCKNDHLMIRALRTHRTASDLLHEWDMYWKDGSLPALLSASLWWGESERKVIAGGVPLLVLGPEDEEAHAQKKQIIAVGSSDDLKQPLTTYTFRNSAQFPPQLAPPETSAEAYAKAVFEKTRAIFWAPSYKQAGEPGRPQVNEAFFEQLRQVAGPPAAKEKYGPNAAKHIFQSNVVDFVEGDAEVVAKVKDDTGRRSSNEYASHNEVIAGVTWRNVKVFVLPQLYERNPRPKVKEVLLEEVPEVRAVWRAFLTKFGATPDKLPVVTLHIFPDGRKVFGRRVDVTGW